MLVNYQTYIILCCPSEERSSFIFKRLALRLSIRLSAPQSPRNALSDIQDVWRKGTLYKVVNTCEYLTLLTFKVDGRVFERSPGSLGQSVYTGRVSSGVAQVRAPPQADTIYQYWSPCTVSVCPLLLLIIYSLSKSGQRLRPETLEPKKSRKNCHRKCAFSQVSGLLVRER